MGSDAGAGTGGGAGGRSEAVADGSVDEEHRSIGGYVVCIDRTICVGFEDCVSEAPRAFRLDEEGIATFAEPEPMMPARLLDACAACPVDAIRVIDSEGRQILP